MGREVVLGVASSAAAAATAVLVTLVAAAWLRSATTGKLHYQQKLSPATVCRQRRLSRQSAEPGCHCGNGMRSSQSWDYCCIPAPHRVPCQHMDRMGVLLEMRLSHGALRQHKPGEILSTGQRHQLIPVQPRMLRLCKYCLAARKTARARASSTTMAHEGFWTMNRGGTRTWRSQILDGVADPTRCFLHWCHTRHVHVVGGHCNQVLCRPSCRNFVFLEAGSGSLARIPHMLKIQLFREGSISNGNSVTV